MTKKTQYLFKLEKQSLSSISHHFNIDIIQRFAPSEFPIHLAVHKVNANKKNSIDYTFPHKHNYNELNLILSEKGELTYRLTIGKKKLVVTSPMAVWIPKGTTHTANVIKGKGHFICIVFGKKYLATKG